MTTVTNQTEMMMKKNCKWNPILFSGLTNFWHLWMFVGLRGRCIGETESIVIIDSSNDPCCKQNNASTFSFSLQDMVFDYFFFCSFSDIKGQLVFHTGGDDKLYPLAYQWRRVHVSLISLNNYRHVIYIGKAKCNRNCYEFSFSFVRCAAQKPSPFKPTST